MIETQSLSSLDAEQYVLGACLVSAQSFEAAFTAIPCGGYFSLRDHQIIFDAMIRLAGVGQVIGRNTIAQLLRQDKVWAAIGGENKLLELAIQGADAHGFTIESACSEVVGYHKRREAISAAKSIIEMANDPSIDHSEISPRAQDAVSRLEITSTGGPVSISDCNAAIYQRMVTEMEPGILTGLYDFDAMSYGAEPGNLIIIGARPGMGKTVMGLNWAGFAANILRKQVLYFSLEMSRDELAIRYASALSGVNSRRIRAHQIASDETVEQVVAAFPSMPRSLYIDECDGGATLDYMTATIRAEHRLGKCQMVVIDHLHLMEYGNRKGEMDVSAIGRITKTFKKLARKLGIAIVLLCQLSRALESRPNKRPMNSDLRESGSVEQDADKIIMLYRDEVYNPDTPDKAIVELIITKNRNGPTGTARALAELEFCRFRNLLS